MKQELIAKGALASWALSKEFENATLQDSPNNVFSRDQHQRFGIDQLVTGGWFLECTKNYVHEEEKHLFRVAAVGPVAVAGVPMETNDDDLEVFQSEPAAQRRGPKLRRCRNAPIQPAPSLALVNARYDGAVLTRASQPAVSNPSSPPRSSTMNFDSAQSLLRLRHSKLNGRAFPLPKVVGTSSSSPPASILPLYFEKGDMCDLINESEHKKVMEPQLVRIVEHIKKVRQYHT